MTALTLSPAEVATRIGCSERFLRDLARDKQVPCLRVGRKAIRFTEDHVAAILAHLEEPAESAVTSLTTARSRRRSA